MNPMESISFVVEGEPKGQPRPRAFARMVNGVPRARVYDKGTAEEWKSQIALAARPHNKGVPIECAVRLSCRFHFARPKSHYGTGRNAAILKDSAPRFHTGRPDLDNIIKALKDALTGIRLWRDDSLVVQYGRMEKVWSDRDYTGVAIEWAGATA